ncbi:sigma-70 family RNA polymerase sigma factor [Pseudomonas sp. S36]|nr:sigma-70 family RNA polymerase sigma factor [Pseudomonas sp. S36]
MALVHTPLFLARIGCRASERIAIIANTYHHRRAFGFMGIDHSFERDVERLYTAHHGWLRGWLTRRLGDSNDVEDLAHDTFVRVMRARKPVNQLRQPMAYLSTIANGLVMNRWRRLTIERAYADALASMPERVEPSAEDRAVLIESVLQVEALLQGLSPRVRTIFLLSQLDGLTYKEIALQLTLSVDQVQKAMTQAFRRCYCSLFE